MQRSIERDQIAFAICTCSPGSGPGYGCARILFQILPRCFCGSTVAAVSFSCSLRASYWKGAATRAHTATRGTFRSSAPRLRHRCRHRPRAPPTCSAHRRISEVRAWRPDEADVNMGDEHVVASPSQQLPGAYAMKLAVVDVYAYYGQPDSEFGSGGRRGRLDSLKLDRYNRPAPATGTMPGIKLF